MANPYETAARATKVDALLRQLDTLMRRVAKDLGREVAVDETIRVVEGWTDKEWRTLAVLADVRPPHSGSRKALLDELRARAAAEAVDIERFGWAT